MMPPLRPDTVFLVLLVVLLFAALVVTSADAPGAPALAALSPRPMPTATATAMPGWWDGISFATPSLPGLPGVPDVSLGGAGANNSRPLSFRVVSCPDPQARITSITDRGVWWLIDGVAGADPFWYWKAELSPDGRGWTLLYRSETPVPGGRLMEFNTTTVPRGAYRLRLVVVKRDGNYPEPCVIQVVVAR